MKRLGTVGALCLCAAAASAQTAPKEFDRIGFQPNRDYLQLLPFERLDTMSGNIVLTLPQLTLPGNAGQTLQFQLTYNAAIFTVGVAPWTFGIAGLPMQVDEQATPGSLSPVSNTIAGTWGTTPVLRMADGGTRRTMFLKNPNSAGGTRWFTTSDFWQYDRTLKKIYLPDGRIGTYSTDPDGRLSLALLEDAFGNTLTLQWTKTGTAASQVRELHVVQSLGGGSSRSIDFVMNGLWVPTEMTYDGRTWRYVYDGSLNREGELVGLYLPDGSGWTFDYFTPVEPLRRLRHLTTPNGGEVTYDYTHQLVAPPNEYQLFLTGRTIGGRAIPAPPLPSGHSWPWEFAYAYAVGSGYNVQTVVTTPSARLTYVNGPVGPAGHELIDGAIGPTHILVEGRRSGGSFVSLESEDRTYQRVNVITQPGGSSFDGAEVASRTIRRGDHSYTTAYTYNTANHGDYRHPRIILETGELTRTTQLTYTHPKSSPETTSRLIVGLPTSQTVDAEGETWTRTWAYESGTGFRTTATEFAALGAVGYPTTWTHDAQGNVASVRNGNNRTTRYTYAWGQVEDTTTPLYVIHRTINPDGTVTSDTRANRTTTLQYDALSRLHVTRPPGGTTPIVVDYDPGGTWIRTTRGTAHTTTTLDGFGRPIESVNSLGVRRRTAYDAEGRVTYEGYPFVGSVDIGSAIQYDALGRVTRRTNPDATSATRVYGAGTVGLTDENGHTTLQTWKAYGDPDEARLTSLADANGQTWRYAYHALGPLWTVQTPDNLFRTWQYNDKNRLSSEFHPESGTTTYATYDFAGNLSGKTDAIGTAFQYGHDANDRVDRIVAGTHVTTIAYEPGSDRRLTTNDGTVKTTFVYDATTGRLSRQQQAIGAYVLNTDYRYDDNDAVTEIAYPSARRISYALDSERRITGVIDTTANRTYASDLTYHPSGALQALTSGNGIATVIGYDTERYWLTSISSGDLQLGYDQYDGVGNVGAIGDQRAGHTQAFRYDSLDRLVSATGPYGTAAYAYDAHGNRQTGSGTTYSYQSNTLRLTQQGATALAYDANGNLTSASGASGGIYAYTPEDWLKTATVGGVTTTYTYDADGSRVRAVAQGQTTIYARAADGTLLTEWKNPGPAGHVRDYVYAGSRLLAAVDHDVATTPNACGGTSIPDGSPTAITIATPGGSGSAAFEGSACRRVSVRATLTSGTLAGCWSLTMLRPDRTTVLGSASMCGATGFIEPVVLPESGVFTVVVKASTAGSGLVTVEVFDVEDVVGEVVPDGLPLPTPLLVPGQRALAAFTGIAGRRVSIRSTVTSGLFGCWYVTLVSPGGAELARKGVCQTASAMTNFIEPIVLAEPGVYTIVVDPSGTNTGTGTLNAYDVVDAATPIEANGPAMAIDLTTPGRNARLPFQGIAGHRVSVKAGVTSGTFGCFYLKILNPAGTPVSSDGLCGPSLFLEPALLPVSGTYTVFVDPSAANTGTGTVSLYDVVDVATPIVPNGPAVDADLSIPGTRMLLPFSGIQGHRMSLTVALTGSSQCGPSWKVRVLKADGSDVATTGNLACTATGYFFEPFALPATGVYTIAFDPLGTHTAVATLRLYDVGDVTGLITPNGVAVPIALNTPGQVARLTFTGIPAHKMTATVTVTSGGFGCSWALSMLKPDGASLGSTTSCGGTTKSLGTLTIPTGGAGIYTVVVDPKGSATGSANVTLKDTP